jgi:dihydropteroate synthase
MYKSSVEDTHFRSNNLIRIKDKLMDLSTPKVMGIINCTPDSFYKHSQKTKLEDALIQAEKHINEGADILDLGGYSTRPGATEISIQEELDRVIPVIEKIKSTFDIPISLDTFRSQIAVEGLKKGVDLINDISGFEIDPKIVDVVSKYKCPYILMHMKGGLKDMHSTSDNEHFFKDIILYFSEKINFLKSKGIHDIILDPGFGFSKTLEQNYFLLNNLESLKLLQTPLLVGISRKSMIYKYLNTTANEALNGTTILNTVSLQKGASILRVHDVKEAVETIKLIEQLNNVSI